METYSEKVGKEPFDWSEFLNKKEFTFDELKDARLRSKDWVTCAVGNQCSCIPRDEIGEPIDVRLQYLGVEFYRSISRIRYSFNNWGYVNGYFVGIAKEVLAEIEKRSAELIEEYNKN